VVTFAPEVESRLALIDAILYGDGFDCAVTLDELWRFARAPVAREELERRLRLDPVLRRIVVERGGLYCLAGREPILDLRRPRVDRARRLGGRARRVAAVLRHVPFVRGVVLTGSVAALDAPARADVDVLVVAARGRLATVFLVLGPASRLVRRLFCPNYYLAEDRLRMADGDVYLAREIAQAQSLGGAGDGFRAANRWVADVFPNLAIDGGEVGGEPSTVIDLTAIEEGGKWRVLREGAVGRPELERRLAAVGA